MSIENSPTKSADPTDFPLESGQRESEHDLKFEQAEVLLENVVGLMRKAKDRDLEQSDLATIIVSLKEAEIALEDALEK